MGRKGPIVNAVLQIFELFRVCLQLVGELLCLVVDPLQDDRGGGLALRVCLRLDRVHVGGAGRGDRGDGFSEWTHVLRDRNDDLSKPPHCFGCLV